MSLGNNEYIIIQEQNEEEIIKGYKESIITIDDVPEDYINHWISMYLEQGYDKDNLFDEITELE